MPDIRQQREIKMTWRGEQRLRFLPTIDVFVLALLLNGYAAAACVATILAVPSRTVTIPFRIAVLGIVTLFFISRLRLARVLGTRTAILVLVLMGALCIRILADIVFGSIPNLLMTPQEFYANTFGIAFFPAVASFFIRAETFRPSDKRFLLLVTLITTAFAAVLAVNSFDTIETQRLSLEYINPISLGHLGLMLAILGIAFFLEKGSGGNRVFKFVFCPAAMIVGTLVALRSNSRGVQVAAGVVVLGVALLGGKSRLRLIVGGMILAVALFVVVRFSQGSASISDTLFSRWSEVDDTGQTSAERSSDVRVELLSSSMKYFQEAPILGYSVVEPESGFYPHNIIAEVLLSTGIAGFIIFAMLLVRLLNICRLALKDHLEHLWIVLLFMQYLVADQFSGSLYFDPNLWLFMVLLAGLSARRPRNRRSGAKALAEPGFPHSVSSQQHAAPVGIPT